MEVTEQTKSSDAQWVEQPADEPQELRSLELLVLLARRKRFLLRTIVLGMVVGVIVAVLLPRRYEGSARIMPPQQSQSIASAMASQLGPLAGLVPKELQARSQSELFIALLKSRTIGDRLVERFSLMKVYGKRTVSAARKKLEDSSDISSGKEGVIKIAVEDADRIRSADLANAYVDELRKLTQGLAVTEASRRRIFYEAEVHGASDALAKAEQALKQTQETTRVIQLDSQSKAMIEAYMSLRAQLAAKEVQVASMSGFATPDNPDLVRTQREVAALRSQVARFESDASGAGINIPLEKLPTAGLEYIRRLRDVKYREALFELLLKQLEIARIDEAKDAAIIQAIDDAVPPDVQVHDWLFRSAAAVLIVLLSLIAGVTAIAIMEAWRQRAEDPRSAAQLHLLRFYLSKSQSAAD